MYCGRLEAEQVKSSRIASAARVAKAMVAASGPPARQRRHSTGATATSSAPHTPPAHASTTA